MAIKIRKRIMNKQLEAFSVVKNSIKIKSVAKQYTTVEGIHPVTRPYDGPGTWLNYEINYVYTSSGIHTGQQVNVTVTVNPLSVGKVALQVAPILITLVPSGSGKIPLRIQHLIAPGPESFISFYLDLHIGHINKVYYANYFVD